MDRTRLPKAVHGRRYGRPLGATRKAALDDLLPRLSIDKALVTQQGNLDPSSFFDAEKITLEIGFGNGEHLAGLMRREPGTGFIGAEPFVNGMSAFLTSIKDDPHDHVRVWMDDAIMLVRSLTPACLDEIYILNPDPWPKTRHHKRRIVRPETLDDYARALKPGGRLILTTDVPGLAEWMLIHTFSHPAFEWTAESSTDWLSPPPGWIPTRYETKGAKGAAKMTYMVFQKRLDL